MNKYHAYRESHRLLQTIHTTRYKLITNTIVSSLAAGWPINAWPDIFLQVTSPRLPGRELVFYYKYQRVSTWFFVCFVRLYFVWRFGVANRWTSSKSCWRCCSTHHIRICDLICSKGLRSYLTIHECIRNESVICMTSRILCPNHFKFNSLTRTKYLTSNFNSLIFFENYYWISHLD